MKYYIDIVLIPNKEDTLAFIWQKVYTQMHLALVEIKDDDNGVAVGFSFPYYRDYDYNEYFFPLGDTLRVFSVSKELLEALKIEHWLERLEGYVHIGKIKTVPTNINKYISFGRQKFKTNREALARRQAKRKGISYEEAIQNYASFDENKNKTKLPYVNIKSLSTGREMKVFIKKSEPKERKDGLFSTYGLSNKSTVPWF